MPTILQIAPDDRKTMNELAVKLMNTPNVNTRMALQQQFVHRMSETYGQEKAARMLTQVWKLVKNKEILRANP